MGPGGFFPTNPDLADILGDTDFDFENFYVLDLLDPKFPDFQVPDFQISRNLAWARLGPWEQQISINHPLAARMLLNHPSYP